jgi:hypothetical protein
VIYYKIVVAGRPQVVFAGVEKLVAGSGEAVARTLLHRLKKDGITIEKVMAFGSDGASIMLGHVGGVAGILLSMNLLLVAFHCVNHRGALAIEGAADESSYLINKFIPTIEALGRFFKYSHTLHLPPLLLKTLTLTHSYRQEVPKREGRHLLPKRSAIGL